MTSECAPVAEASSPRDTGPGRPSHRYGRRFRGAAVLTCGWAIVLVSAAWVASSSREIVSEDSLIPDEPSASAGTCPPPQPRVSPSPLTVRSVHHTPKYTILELGEDGPGCWVAAPRLDVHVGDRVAYADAVEVPNFRSDTLGRTFARMLLAMYVFKIDGTGKVVPANPHAAAGDAPKSLRNAGESLEKTRPRGSVCTVAQVVSQSASLAGQDLTLRGVVASATYDVRPAPASRPSIGIGCTTSAEATVKPWRSAVMLCSSAARRSSSKAVWQ